MRRIVIRKLFRSPIQNFEVAHKVKKVVQTKSATQICVREVNFQHSAFTTNAIITVAICISRVRSFHSSIRISVK
jgi:hypothetical protein